MGLINEIGNIYGYLTVIERDSNDINGRARWKCQCKCGKITTVLGKHLRSGNTKSCGCLKQENRRVDLRGQRFGRLLVLGDPIPNSRGTQWKCLCDCGTICYKVSSDLVSGNTQSCGCLKKDLHSTMNDLTNQKFGRLTALETKEIAPDGQRIWICQCDCGNIISVLAGNLRKGNTTSCGCSHSKNNLYIREYLINAKIDFIPEYSFVDLYSIQGFPLKFDFAIFKNNQLIKLIEYNGIQHYQPIDFFGGQSGFLRQQYLDQLKKEYTEKHHLDFHIIKYDEDLNTRLGEIFINEL